MWNIQYWLPKTFKSSHLRTTSFSPIVTAVHVGFSFAGILPFFFAVTSSTAALFAPCLDGTLCRLSSSLTSAPAVFQPGVFLPLVDPLIDPQRGRAGEGSRGWYPEMEKRGGDGNGAECWHREKWCTILGGSQLLLFTTTQVNWHSCVETRLKPCKHGY